MSKTPVSYAAAQEELQRILEQLQQPDASLDALRDQVARAKELIDWSRTRLRETELEVDKLLAED